MKTINVSPKTKTGNESYEDISRWEKSILHLKLKEIP